MAVRVGFGLQERNRNMIGVSKLCLAGLAVLAGSAWVPQPVFAQTLELQIGPDGVKPRFVEPYEEEYQSPRRARRGCDLDEATDIARDEGLRRPRVVDVTKRRGCPVIG